jgi:hypothetical protein
MKHAQEKFIQQAIKEEGALRKHFGVKEGEKIPVGKAKAEYKRLQEKAKGEKKLKGAEAKLFDQLHLFLKVLQPASKKKASLRDKTIRLAFRKPHLREHLLPLLTGDH